MSLRESNFSRKSTFVWNSAKVASICNFKFKQLWTVTKIISTFWAKYSTQIPLSTMLSRNRQDLVPLNFYLSKGMRLFCLRSLELKYVSPIANGSKVRKRIIWNSISASSFKGPSCVFPGSIGNQTKLSLEWPTSSERRTWSSASPMTKEWNRRTSTRRAWIFLDTLLKKSRNIATETLKSA